MYNTFSTNNRINGLFNIIWLSVKKHVLLLKPHFKCYFSGYFGGDVATQFEKWMASVTNLKLLNDKSLENINVWRPKSTCRYNKDQTCIKIHTKNTLKPVSFWECSLYGHWHLLQLNTTLHWQSTQSKAGSIQDLYIKGVQATLSKNSAFYY